MKCRFLSQKGSGGGRGIKEKRSNVSNIEVVKDGVVPSVKGDSRNAAMEVESPLVVEETVEKENLSHVVNTSDLGSYPPLPTQETTSAGNAPGKGDGIDVVVPVESIRAISKRFFNTAYGYFLGKRMAYPVVANYVRNTRGSMEGLNAMLENGPWFIRNNPIILKKWHPDVNLLKEDVGTVPVWVKLHGVSVTAFSKDGLSAIATKLAMIELRADVELKDNIVVAMPKFSGEGYYTSNIRVEYEWKL
ncbi:pyruvate, phosphate dikinase, chloroplastic [Tanacetum coccineum]